METAKIWRGDGIRRICYGNYQHTVTGITIERNRDVNTGNVVEIIYEVPEENALSSQPAMGSRTDLLAGVVLIKTTTTPGTAGIASVKLTYGKPEPTDDEDEEEEGSEQLKGFKSTLDVTVVDEPILTHQKCAGIAGDQLEYLKALIDGARMWELVPQVKATGELILDKDGQVVKKKLGKLIKGNTGLVKLLQQGVTSYKCMMAIYTYSYQSKSGRVNPEDVGKIDTPHGAPALTRVLLPDEPRRFWVLSNAPGKDLNRLALAEGDALVFLNRAVDWPQAQGLPLRKIAFCRRNARSKGEWFLPKAGGLEGFDDMLLLTDRVVEAEHAWMKDYRHATGYHPTTGWIAYRLLREQFPAARITLVDFRPDGDIGTYKWPKHDWAWEAVFYRKHGVEIVSARG